MLSKRNGAMKHQGLSALVTFVGIWPDVTSHLRKAVGWVGPSEPLRIQCDKSWRNWQDIHVFHTNMSHIRRSLFAANSIVSIPHVSAKCFPKEMVPWSTKDFQPLSHLLAYGLMWLPKSTDPNHLLFTGLWWGGKHKKKPNTNTTTKEGVCVCMKESAEATIV